MQSASYSGPDISVALWVKELEMKKWIMDWLQLQRKGQQRIYEDQMSEVKKKALLGTFGTESLVIKRLLLQNLMNYSRIVFCGYTTNSIKPRVF